MNSREFLGHYARSPYGIGSAFVALVAGIGLVAGGLAPGFALVAAMAIVALALALGLALGWGQKAASLEGEREDKDHARSRMATVTETRRRLAALRLAPGPVAEARDLIALESGRLVETFAATGAWDPEAVQACVDALALVDAWLRETDEAATERRFALPDANPFPKAAERTAAALRDKAALIAAHRAAAAGEIPPADRVAIEEELK